jgi:hypothetical protein
MRSMTPVITQLSTALFHLRSNILYSTYIFYNIIVRMLIYTGIPTATYQLMGTFYIKFTQIILIKLFATWHVSIHTRCRHQVYSSQSDISNLLGSTTLLEQSYSIITLILTCLNVPYREALLKY